MAYKWKPSKTQKREFANNMKDEKFANDYRERKEKKAQKKRTDSKFDYNTAGGQYIPTQEQYNKANEFLQTNISIEQQNACHLVIFGYTCKEKVNHDSIHIVNELIRSN